LKYELIEINLRNNKFYRIKALKNFSDVMKGDIGGFVENENNLSQEGSCWIYGNSEVSGSSIIKDDAKIFGSLISNSIIENNSCIYNSNIYDSEISDSNIRCSKVIGGHISEYANIMYSNIDGNNFIDIKGNVYIYRSDIYGKCKIYDKVKIINSKIYDSAKIMDCAVVEDSSVYNNSHIYNNAKVKKSKIFNNAKIYENASVTLNSEISENAKIHGNVFVTENVFVYNDVDIFGNAIVIGSKIFDSSKIYDSAYVKNSYIYGDSKIYGYSRMIKVIISDDCEIYQNANLTGVNVSGGARIYGYTELDGKYNIGKYASISDNSQVLYFPRNGNCINDITFYKDKDKKVYVYISDIEIYSIDELKNKILKHEVEYDYKMYIDFAEKYFVCGGPERFSDYNPPEEIDEENLEDE